MTTPLKSCSRCKVLKPAELEFFGRNKTRKDGLNPECKKCRSTRSKTAYHKDIEQSRNKARDWRANHPGQQAQYSRDWRNKSPDNRQKQRAAALRWYYENYEHALNRNRDWQQKNPHMLYMQSARRYALRKNATGKITSELVDRIFEDQNHFCFYCQCDLDESGYHIEHKIPLSRGGTNEPNNICLACPKCNLSKGTKTPDEWNPH